MSIDSELQEAVDAMEKLLPRLNPDQEVRMPKEVLIALMASGVQAVVVRLRAPMACGHPVTCAASVNEDGTQWEGPCTACVQERGSLFLEQYRLCKTGPCGNHPMACWVGVSTPWCPACEAQAKAVAEATASLREGLSAAVAENQDIEAQMRRGIDKAVATALEQAVRETEIEKATWHPSKNPWHVADNIGKRIHALSPDPHYVERTVAAALEQVFKHTPIVNRDYSLTCSCGWKTSPASSRPTGLEFNTHVKALISPDPHYVERRELDARIYQYKKLAHNYFGGPQPNCECRDCLGIATITAQRDALGKDGGK